MNWEALKHLLDQLGAGSALAVLVGAEEHIAQIERAGKDALDSAERKAAALEERLKKAMEREAELKTANAALTAHNAQLVAEMNRLESHPEVRAAKRVKLEMQAADLAKQIAALTPAEPTTPAKPPTPTDAKSE